METASHLSGGIVIVNLLREEQDLLFSQNYACDDCGISIEELTPRMFSFNNPYGACPTCTGLGMLAEGGPRPDDPGRQPLHSATGPSRASGWNSIRSDGICRHVLRGPGQEISVLPPNTPFEELPEDVRQTSFSTAPAARSWSCTMTSPGGKGVLYQPFEGMANNLERRYQETQSDASKRGDRGVHEPNAPARPVSGKPPEAGGAGGDGGGPDHLAGFTELPVDKELAFFNGSDLDGDAAS